MKVSIIITCFNLGKYLPESLASIRNQTYKNFEVIIVNDGSTETETLEILKELQTSGIKILTTTNKGVANARNTGILESKGEYICCLDADDAYAPSFLEKTTTLLNNFNEIGFVTTWAEEFGLRQGIWKTQDYNPIILLTQNIVHVASIFRRKCWEEVNGYNSSLSGYQDWNFWISITSKGYKWARIEEPLFYYRVRENSMIQGSIKKRYELISQIIEINKSYFQQNISEVLINMHKKIDLINKENDDLNSELKHYKKEVMKLKKRYKIFEDLIKKIKTRFK